MIQILYAIIGFLALRKGELKVTADRVLSRDRARGVGVAFLILAALPFFVNLRAYSPMVIIFGQVGAGVTLTVLALMLSQKKGSSPDEPPTTRA